LFVTGAVDPFGKRTVSEILDPPMAHVTALSDGRNGTAVFVSLDAFGITSVDVGRIRAALKDFAADPANNIISINVSALHQHSVIDTLGMNGNILAAVFANTFAQLTGWYPPFSGKNQDYMKNVTKVVADTVKEAVGGMEEGTLHYGKADVREYINEKRAPDCFDPYFHRLRFKPTATASPETWLCNAAIHPTGLGTSDTKVSGDWPYFIGEALKDYNGGTNFQFINGAELAMGIKFDEPMPDATGYQRMRRYGSLLADKLKGITGEIQLPSLLNIAHKEYLLPVDNPLHLLFFRLGAIESSGRKKDLLGLDLELKTELGYMELGGKVAVALVPGELEPALAFDGNGLAKEESYRREEYKFTPMREMAGPGIEHFMVFGLTNDQIGYILLPNDIAHFVVFGNEEVNTASTKSAPLTLAAFKALTESVR
ncbi:MAG: hypothetical protein FWC27_03040, partial [Firmicutes bacterium]|nr:hypothetical protein [Bacillota bacterium]